MGVTEEQGWGWWSVFSDLDDLEKELISKYEIPNPGITGSVPVGHELSPTELQDSLQAFGSYASRLFAIEGKFEAQLLALKEGYKNGMSVAMQTASGPTIKDREGAILANNEIFSNTKKLQIETEAKLALVQGWRKSYEKAWETISRIITFRTGEVSLATGRHL